MAKKKHIVRSVICSQITLFIILFDVVGVCLVGCCTKTVFNGQFGATTSSFEPPRYYLSHDRREIIVRSTKRTNYHYSLPLPSFSQNVPVSRTTYSKWEGHIPLEPVPDNLMRCRLTVEQDPDAPEYGPYDHGSFEVEIDDLPIGADETIHLRVRPQDMYLLRNSDPFRIRLIPRSGAGADGQAAESDAAQNQQQKMEDGNAVSKPAGEPRLMIPVASDGNTYELLTVAPCPPRQNPYRKWLEERSYENREEMKKQGLSYLSPNQRAILEQAAEGWDRREENRYLFPFLEEQDEICMIEYERITGDRWPTFGGILWKALWLPTAVVADVILMPVYIVYFGCLGIAITMIFMVGSAIQ